MMNWIYTLLIVGLCLFATTTKGQEEMHYAHDSVRMTDLAKKPYGAWLFEPASPQPDSAPVVVFIHGYGGYNPMIYGAWITHLVRQGHTVIFPRYQRNIVFPRPPKFVKNTSRGIRMAWDTLQQSGRVHPIRQDGPVLYVGHSYGGVITANIALTHEKWGIPQPEAAFLLAPGSGPLKGGVLDDYSEMPSDILLHIIIHENDWVVGDALARRIFTESNQVQEKRLLDHRVIFCGQDTLSAHHNEAYGVGLQFDTGLRNYTSKKALRVGEVNAIDQQVLWPLVDHLSQRLNQGYYEQHFELPIAKGENASFWPLQIGTGCEEAKIRVEEGQ